MHKRYYGINEPALVAWRIGARRWFASITMVRRVCELD
jgi:hypothetical protein